MTISTVFWSAVDRRSHLSATHVDTLRTAHQATQGATPTGETLRTIRSDHRDLSTICPMRVCVDQECADQIRTHATLFHALADSPPECHTYTQDPMQHLNSSPSALDHHNLEMVAVDQLRDVLGLPPVLREWHTPEAIKAALLNALTREEERLHADRSDTPLTNGQLTSEQAVWEWFATPATLDRHSDDTATGLKPVVAALTGTDLWMHVEVTPFLGWTLDQDPHLSKRSHLTSTPDSAPLYVDGAGYVHLWTLAGLTPSHHLNRVPVAHAAVLRILAARSGREYLPTVFTPVDAPAAAVWALLTAVPHTTNWTADEAAHLVTVADAILA